MKAPVVHTASTARQTTDMSSTESELIKELDSAAMASVVADRALKVLEQGIGVRNTLIQSIKKPIPPASLSHGQPLSADIEELDNFFQ